MLGLEVGPVDGLTVGVLVAVARVGALVVGGSVGAAVGGLVGFTVAFGLVGAGVLVGLLVGGVGAFVMQSPPSNSHCTLLQATSQTPLP